MASIDPLLNRTSIGYDAAGRPISTTNPLGIISTAVYDAANRRVASIDPLGNRSSLSYDAANRPIRTTNPLGIISTAVYDAANRENRTLIRS